MRYGDPRNFELHFIYRVFRADGVLLYVGCTRDPWGRFAHHHRRPAPWWAEAERVEWTAAGNMFQAQHLERLTIKAEQPLYNFQHNSDSAREAYRLGIVA